MVNRAHQSKINKNSHVHHLFLTRYLKKEPKVIIYDNCCAPKIPPSEVEDKFFFLFLTSTRPLEETDDHFGINATFG